MTGSFLDRLTLCQKTVRLQRRKDKQWLEFNQYDLWQQKFTRQDLKTNLGKNLGKQYANKLLVPLFQKNPLYAQVNLVSNRNRFTLKNCLADFAGKITAKNPETIFILVSDSDTQTKPLENLVGEISIFAADPVELYESKLKVGVIGSMTDDTVEAQANFPFALKDLKYAYFNGIGVAEPYQNLGVGVYLLYQGLKEFESRNFKILITRVMKKANNYQLMKRLGDNVVLTYSNPRFGKNYRVVFSAPIKTMLEKLKLELKRKFINYQDLL